jgi:hypothetical protein
MTARGWHYAYQSTNFDYRRLLRVSGRRVNLMIPRARPTAHAEDGAADAADVRCSTSVVFVRRWLTDGRSPVARGLRGLPPRRARTTCTTWFRASHGMSPGGETPPPERRMAGRGSWHAGSGGRRRRRDDVCDHGKRASVVRSLAALPPKRSPPRAHDTARRSRASARRSRRKTGTEIIHRGLRRWPSPPRRLLRRVDRATMCAHGRSASSPSPPRHACPPG